MPGLAENFLNIHEENDDDARHPDIVDAGERVVTANVGEQIRAQQVEQVAALGIRQRVFLLLLLVQVVRITARRWYRNSVSWIT